MARKKKTAVSENHTVRFSESDKELHDYIIERYGITSTSNVVRMALRFLSNVSQKRDAAQEEGDWVSFVRHDAEGKVKQTFDISSFF